MPASDPVLHPQDAEERSVAYSPSSCIDDISVHLDAYRDASAVARSCHEPNTIRYGVGERAEYDVFEAADADTVHLFFHGGYWQELSKSDASFPARALLDRGVTYVAGGYDLAPGASLEAILEQAVEAVQSVRAEVCRPSQRLVLSGSSAGAYLAAAVSLFEPVDALLLLSGIYELTPLVGTYINDALGLDHKRASALSPLRWLSKADPPPGATFPKTLLVWGEHETEAFKRQSDLYSVALRRHGAHVETLEMPGRNHFDLVDELAQFELSD